MTMATREVATTLAGRLATVTATTDTGLGQVAERAYVPEHRATLIDHGFEVRFALS